MGYYTDYTITVDTSDISKEEFKNKLEEFSGYEFFWDEDNQLKGIDSFKWSFYSDTMDLLSKEYPNKLILLEGRGEEASDIWRLYVQNGKSFYEKASIVFKEFTSNNLARGLQEKSNQH